MTEVTRVSRFFPDVMPPTRDQIEEPTSYGAKYLIVGKPGTGKSHLMRYLVASKSHLIPVGMFINGSESSTGFYGKFAPRLYVHPEFDMSLMRNPMDRHAVMPVDVNRYTMVVIDDCSDMLKQFRNKTKNNHLNTLLKNGRHHRILILIGVQRGMDVSSDIRTNLDGVFLFKTANKTELKHLYEAYGQEEFVDEKAFSRAFAAVTQQPYTAMFIKLSSNSNTDCPVMWARAPKEIPNDVRFGCMEYRFNSSIRLDTALAANTDGELRAQRERVAKEQAVAQRRNRRAVSA